MTLPKKLQQTRDKMSEEISKNLWHEEECFDKGFEAGAEAVLREAEKLVEVLQHQIANNKCYDCSCGTFAEDAITEWREFTGSEK